MKKINLIDATMLGSRKRVAKLIEEGINISISTGKSFNACIDIDAVNNNRYNQTALMNACYAGHFKIVQLLIKAGANVNLQDYNGDTALIMVFMRKRNRHIGNKLRILRQLIRAGADVNIKNKNGKTALMKSSTSSNTSSITIQIINELIKAGADINAQCNSGYSPLISSSSYDNVNVAKELIKANADLNLYDIYNKETALMKCSVLNYVKTALELIKAGADLNLQNYQGKTALMISSHILNYSGDLFHKYFIIFKELVKAGANLYIKDNNSKNIFDIIAEHRIKHYLGDSIYLKIERYIEKVDLAYKLLLITNAYTYTHTQNKNKIYLPKDIIKDFILNYDK